MKKVKVVVPVADDSIPIYVLVVSRPRDSEDEFVVDGFGLTQSYLPPKDRLLSVEETPLVIEGLRAAADHYQFRAELEKGLNTDD